MTSRPPDIFVPPHYNDNATNNLRTYSPPSTTTTTSPPPSSRRPRTHNGPRPRTTSTTASAGGSTGMMTTKRSDIPTEFYIPVELYLSPKASAGLRKVRHPSLLHLLAYSVKFHNWIYLLLTWTPFPSSLLPLPAASVGAYSPLVREV